MTNCEDVLSIASKIFPFEGAVQDISHHGEGHINHTFCITAVKEDGSSVRYILQRINTEVFTDPDGLMENIVGVTDYLAKAIREKGGDPTRETIRVLRTRKDTAYYRDADGSCWRVYPFVEGTVCLQKAETPQQFYQSARIFGRFQQLLADYPAHTLHETIARFHDTRDRFAKFEAAVRADCCGRAASVKREIDFVLARKADCSVLMDLLESGKLPLRVTHNDTKLNNILMDAKTREGLCVIDLDTVMPGLSLNDFGDSIRFGANHAAEDEQDLSKVNFDLPLYEIYTKGFLETAGCAMTRLEKEYLPWGARLMTLECGIRFLTDYLEGDHYFHIHREHHNLDRCRTQFKLVSDMEAHWDEMNAIVAKYA